MHFRLLAIAILLGWCHAAFSDEHGREHVIPLFVPNDAAVDNGAAGQQQGFLRDNQSFQLGRHGADLRF